MTDVLRRLRCTAESCKTVCIFMIVYLERMIESFEDLTLDDFEMSPYISPMAQTTMSGSYSGKAVSPNKSVSSRGISKKSAPITKV